MERNKVYEAIDSERDYQDTQWNASTSTSAGNHSIEEWIIYIEDYLNEAKHLLSRKSVQASYPLATSIMRKVAAMSVKCLEDHGVENREIKEPATETVGAYINKDVAFVNWVNHQLVNRMLFYIRYGSVPLYQFSGSEKEYTVGNLYQYYKDISK